MRQPHVLLVEQDAAVRAATCMLLKVAGYRVAAAASIAEAAAQAHQHDDLEVVIADYQLGNIEDGIDAIAAVRAVRGPCLKALLVSADTGFLLTDLAGIAGMSTASKPINPDELVAILAAPQA
jgi:CheY-like chemotaxis protein